MNLLADPLCKRYTVTLLTHKKCFSKKRLFKEDLKSLIRNMKFRLFVNFEFQDSISLPWKGFFSPFPHGTCSLLVKEEYLGFEGGPPIFKQENSLYFFCREKKWSYRVFTFFDKIFQSFLSFFSFWNSQTFSGSENSCLFRVRSPLLPESRLICNPLATKMFQFAKFHEFKRFPTWKSMDHKMFRFSP